MEWNACMYFHILCFLYRYMHMDLHMQIWIHTYIMPAHIGKDTYVHYIYTVCTVCMCTYIYIYIIISYYIIIHNILIYTYLRWSHCISKIFEPLSSSGSRTGGSTIPTKTACSTDLEASSSTHCVAFKTSLLWPWHPAHGWWVGPHIWP